MYLWYNLSINFSEEPRYHYGQVIRAAKYRREIRAAAK